MDKSSTLSISLPRDAVKVQSSVNNIRLYDMATIDQLVWPTDEEGVYTKNFLLPLIKNGTKRYIDNIETRMHALMIDSYVIPIAIVDDNYENSFVCSPFAHYVSYALENSKHFFKQAVLRKIVCGLVKGLGKLLRKGKINKIIYINNWLFPTDLYFKDLKDEHIEALTKYLSHHFPDYTIAFKSINQAVYPQLSQALKNAGYDFIITRQVFLTDTKKEEIFQTRIFKSDLKLLRESRYTILDHKDLTVKDSEKILSLYKHLYLDKYSALNPQINENFMNLVFQSNLLQLKAIKKDGEIEGVFGYFIRDGIMTAPLFGYEANSIENKNLYRLLSTLLTLEAKNKGCLLHQSAGASFYKKLRRAEPHMEFMAVHHKHLPSFRRFPWKGLKFIMNNAKSYFKDY
ncbi:Uncharacterized protein PHSC3_001032 [Chlamydiales bacterium STE3]|nr:Uncharacterized protein PHSC3_001032 [Chlamydiales bacterium STE3]